MSKIITNNIRRYRFDRNEMTQQALADAAQAAFRGAAHSPQRMRIRRLSPAYPPPRGYTQ